MRLTLVAFIILALTACAIQPSKPAQERLKLDPVSFSDLEGWDKDDASQALLAFKKSCTALRSKPAHTSLGIAGTASDWYSVCDKALKIEENKDARLYFEQSFQPYAATSNQGSEGLFTGYYVPELRGALQQGGTFQTPLYERPTDMISVDLGLFKNDLKGQHIVGKVDNNHLVPYDDRAAIVRNSLMHRARPLVWVDDPVSAFFLEVQGSGHIRLTDGSAMSVGYDGANGHAYVAIGRAMADRGDIQRPVTMPAIRTWLAMHPEQAQDIMNINPSYVFFRRLDNNDVIGAEGVALTAQRSLAIDPAFLTLGMPIWLDTKDGQGEGIQRLMIAQDTGGAIKGPVRGDMFWGAGLEAERQAGAMQSQGRYYVLLPKTVTIHDDER